jgi:hypothetical protein
MSKDSEHLKWIHDRIVNVYKENENIDFLIRMRDIINTIQKQEKSFEDYLKFIETSNNPKQR